MSQIPRLLRALSEPLLIDPRVGRQLVHLFARKLGGEAFTGAEIHAELHAARGGVSTSEAAPRIGVITVRGIIAQHPQSMGASTEGIGAQLRALLASRSVDAILFDVDSPGGTVSGVPELAGEIASARGAKPMAALSNGLMASAAYWLGAATGHVFVAPSGETGSIGVYTAHEDWSAALEQDGVKITPVSAGKYKLEGAPWAAPTEEYLATLEERVQEVYGWFVKDVAAFRRDTQQNVRAGYGEGRVLGAAQSVKANLADAVGTFDDAVAWLAARADARKGPSAEANRRRLALDAEAARMA
jgi:signal peptide peptidase SppA